MRIGHEDAFIEIVRRDPADGFSAYRIRAEAKDSSAAFHGSQEAVVFDTSDVTKKKLDDFQAMAAKSAELPVSENGWIRLTRDSHGHITLRYRFGRWKLGAAIEGDVIVEGEFADGFCRDLRKLLWPHST